MFRMYRHSASVQQERIRYNCKYNEPNSEKVINQEDVVIRQTQNDGVEIYIVVKCIKENMVQQTIDMIMTIDKRT